MKYEMNVKFIQFIPCFIDFSHIMNGEWMKDQMNKSFRNKDRKRNFLLGP